METCHAVTTTRVCLYGTFRGFYACSAGLYSSKLILDLPYSEKKGKYQGFLFSLIKYTPVTVALFFFFPAYFYSGTFKKLQQDNRPLREETPPETLIIWNLCPTFWQVRSYDNILLMILSLFPCTFC